MGFNLHLESTCLSQGQPGARRGIAEQACAQKSPPEEGLSLLVGKPWGDGVGWAELEVQTGAARSGPGLCPGWLRLSSGGSSAKISSEGLHSKVALQQAAIFCLLQTLGVGLGSLATPLRPHGLFSLGVVIWAGLFLGWAGP